MDEEWVLIENEDGFMDELEVVSIGERADENINVNSESSYAAAVLRISQQNRQQQEQQRPIRFIEQKKGKPVRKREAEEKPMASYLEAKPGSEYRNPRDKAGKNKVHQGRRRSSSPPRNIGNSAKTGCTFCNPKLSNRVERTRQVRQQCSAVNWKDSDS